MSLGVLLDVAYAHLVKDMDEEQRERFDRLIGDNGGSEGADQTARRAYALAQGEIG